MILDGTVTSERHYVARAIYVDPFASDEKMQWEVLKDETLDVHRSGKKIHPEFGISEFTARFVQLRSRGFELVRTKNKPYLKMVMDVEKYIGDVEYRYYYSIRLNLDFKPNTVCSRCNGSGMYPSKEYKGICLGCGGCGARLN